VSRYSSLVAPKVVSRRRRARKAFGELCPLMASFCTSSNSIESIAQLRRVRWLDVAAMSTEESMGPDRGPLCVPMEPTSALRTILIGECAHRVGTSCGCLASHATRCGRKRFQSLAIDRLSAILTKSRTPPCRIVILICIAQRNLLHREPDVRAILAA
jgi:hypothetical protein